MSASLVDTRSDKEFALSGAPTTIGRYEDNDICLLAPRISRYHAEVKFEGGFWVLEDQGSTYGTYVNGQKVKGTVQLSDGDTISLGSPPDSSTTSYTLIFRKVAERSPLVSKIKRVVRKVVKRKKIAPGRVVLEREGGLLVCKMTSVFRRRECDKLIQSIEQELKGTPSSVVLDVTNVTYLNSYALSVLVELGYRLREDGRHLRVFGAKDAVLRLLALAGQNSPIEVCDTWEEALNRK